MKFLLLLALAVMAFRLVAGRWPWQPGRGLGRGGQGRVTAEARAQAQALLGVAPGAPRAEIIEAHRRLIGMVHPDRGGTSDLVHEANAARDLLLAEIAFPADAR